MKVIKQSGTPCQNPGHLTLLFSPNTHFIFFNLICQLKNKIETILISLIYDVIIFELFFPYPLPINL